MPGAVPRSRCSHSLALRLGLALLRPSAEFPPLPQRALHLLEQGRAPRWPRPSNSRARSRAGPLLRPAGTSPWAPWAGPSACGRRRALAKPLRAALRQGRLQWACSPSEACSTDPSKTAPAARPSLGRSCPQRSGVRLQQAVEQAPGGLPLRMAEDGDMTRVGRHSMAVDHVRARGEAQQAGQRIAADFDPHKH